MFDDRPAVGRGRRARSQAARLRHRTDAERHPPRSRLRAPDARRPRRGRAWRSRTALLLAWLVAAARATGLLPAPAPLPARQRRPAPRRDWDSDRIALVALALDRRRVRPPVGDRLDLVRPRAGRDGARGGGLRGRAAAPLAGARRRRTPRTGAPPPPSPAAAARRRRRAARRAPVAWAVWQPEASDRATERGLELADAGELHAAIAKTEDAADINPLSSEPLLRAGRDRDPGGPRGRRPATRSSRPC